MPIPLHHRTVLRGWLFGILAAAGLAFPVSASAVGFVISEIMFDTGKLPGKVDGQWVELFNGTDFAIDLSTYSLAWGKNAWTENEVQLVGTIAPNETFIIGGPYTGPENGDPIYDQVYDFEKNIQKGNKDEMNGVALFDVTAASIDANTLPYYAVIFGKSTSTILLSDQFSATTADPGTASITVMPPNKFTKFNSIGIDPSYAWAEGAPNAGVFLPNPEPGTAVLLGAGLIMLAVMGRRREPLVRA